MQTANGKEVQPFRDVKGTWRIQFKTGGELPQELSGTYTTDKQAIKDILVYIEKTKERKPKTKE